MKIFLVFIPVLLGLGNSISLSQSPKAIIVEMIQSASNIEGFTAEITKEERIDGEMNKQVTAVKLIRKPFQLYLNQRYPKEGVEILCKEGSTSALINPNSFPWINLSLDPYGSLMRKQQHHTVFDSGFDLMSEILHRELVRIGNDTSSHIFYKGEVSWQGKPAHSIEMSNPSYELQEYTVLLGEDLTSIAIKLNISDYALLELNEDVDFYDDVNPGQIITVPSSYAKRMELFIDKEHLLPFVIKVYDNKGLYEHYAYKKFKLNPGFQEDEFHRDFEEYDF